MSYTRNYRSHRYSYNPKAPHYDACVDSFDSASQEDAEKFMAFIQNLCTKETPEPSSEDSEEASSIEADDLVDAAFQQRLVSLSDQFPSLRSHMRVAAYQAGVYHPRDSCGYDPEINRFIRTMEDIDENTLPADVKLFIKELNKYAEQRYQKERPTNQHK